MYDDWAERIANVIAGIRAQEREAGADDIGTIYQACQDLIEEGRQVAQGILEVSPERDEELASVRGAAATFDQQLDILDRDLKRLLESRENKEATSSNAFQVQVGFLAVDAQADRLYSAITFRAIGIRKGLGDLKDEFGRKLDNIAGKAQRTAAAGTAAVSGAIANFGNWLAGLLKLLGTNLLQLISKLVTPKEWSISGQAGTNLMIFQGAVTLEVTFG